MKLTESVELPAPPSVVFPLVVDLDRYPIWLRLVHRAERLSDDDRPVWAVELRASVGPFSRSKQLRMERTELVTDQRAVFERAETDGRDHADWTLRAELEPIDGGHTRLTMHLAYDGKLWTGGLLERALNEEIKRGRVRLTDLLASSPSS